MKDFLFHKMAAVDILFVGFDLQTGLVNVVWEKSGDIAIAGERTVPKCIWEQEERTSRGYKKNSLGSGRGVGDCCQPKNCSGVRIYAHDSLGEK